MLGIWAQSPREETAFPMRKHGLASTFLWHSPALSTHLLPLSLTSLTSIVDPFRPCLWKAHTFSTAPFLLMSKQLLKCHQETLHFEENWVRLAMNVIKTYPRRCVSMPHTCLNRDARVPGIQTNLKYHLPLKSERWLTSPSVLGRSPAQPPPQKAASSCHSAAISRSEGQANSSD